MFGGGRPFSQHDKRVDFEVPFDAESCATERAQKILSAHALDEAVKQLSTVGDFWMMFHDNGENIFRWWELPEFKVPFDQLKMTVQADLLCVMAEMLDTLENYFTDKVLLPLAESIVGSLPLDENANVLITTFISGREAYGGCSAEQLQVLIHVIGGYLAHARQVVV
jgi:hypothetical protein